LDHYQSVKIFQGKEELLIASFENRSSGVVPILSNLIPTSFLDIEKEFDQVRNDVMLKKQAKLDLLLNKYFPTTKRVQSIKYALSIEGVIQKFFSEKLKDLTEQEESKIESFFEKILA